MSRKFTFQSLVLILLMFVAQNIHANNRLESFLDSKTESIKVYPNPLVDDAIIKINEDIDLSNSKVSVVFYNLLGKEVYKINTVKEYEVKISKDSFKYTGVYFYQLKIDERIQSTGKLIVK
ncbi:MAG: T9SS type A sorting domain-containing protein [Sphingobacteriales bacterium]|nr:MAG: T9SS type A sorting domain-containing protein [Sphingobacteriales bacterium]